MVQPWFTPTPAQWNKLQSILRYAADKVAYYQELFQNLGIEPQDVRTPLDFQQLPTLDKQVIQRRWDDFVSDDYRRAGNLRVSHTSGTTGAPLKIVHTSGENAIAGRCLMKARMGCGLRLPARWAIVGASQHFLAREDDGLAHQYGRGQSEVLLLTNLDAGESTLRQHVRALEAFQPTWLYGSPTTLHTMAQFVLSQGRPLDLHNLQLIELVSEYASAEARRQIHQAFGRWPVSLYGCQEIWGIACECLEGKMHVLSRNTFLEITSSDGSPVSPGEEGEVVVTGLNFRAMPFIRYRLGDLAIPSSEVCACGDVQPWIEIVEGRTADFIVGRPGQRGNLVFDTIMTHMQRRGYTARQFRVVQRSRSHFEAWVVCLAEWGDAAQETFVRKARKVLGPDATFDFRFVDVIPPHPSGKTRSFIVDEAVQ